MILLSVVGMTYIRGQREQIDAWGNLGNKGWNWNSLLPYYKKSESFIPPTQAQTQVGASFDPRVHGKHGPVHVGFQKELQNGTFFETVLEGWHDVGLAFDRDASDGDVHGFDVWPKTCVPALGLRADSAQAYYFPVEGRPNLHLIKGTVARVTWGSSFSIPTANGVEYITSHRGVAFLHASEGVILSAGALRSPGILERSGVGNPKSVIFAPTSPGPMADIAFRLLKSLGIDLAMALPSVGENFQDQPNLLFLFTSKHLYNGTATYSTFPNARDLFRANFATVSTNTRAQLGKWANNIAATSNGAINASALKEILEVQHKLIFDRLVPTTEIITSAKGDLLIGTAPPQVPFSRGRIHINSTDPLAHPIINPQYLAIDSDLDFAIAGARLLRRFYDTSSMQAIINSSVASGVPPATASDSEWAAYLKSSSRCLILIWHAHN